MQVIVAAYKTYVLPYYSPLLANGYFVLTGLLLSMLVLLQNQYGLPGYHHAAINFVIDYLALLVPFAGAYLLQYFFYSNHSFYCNKSFWALVFLAPALFSLRLHLHMPAQVLTFDEIKLSDTVTLNYVFRSGLLIMLTLLLWWIADRKNGTPFGIGRPPSKRLSLSLFVCMLPLVFAAALLPAFQSMYPKMLHEAGLQWPHQAGAAVLFELAYGFDFLSIEFFFRGFLILAFVQYAGMRAIIPAACFYCCIHLGKPLPEVVSSFFGGIVLGSISYHSKSIWTGFYIHIGIAWAMELLSWLIHHYPLLPK